MKPTVRGRRVRRVAVVSSLVAVVGVFGTAGVSFADAGSSDAGSSEAGSSDASGQSPALVGPLLRLFSFGAVVGVPTVCQAASAAVGSGAAQYGQAGTVFPLIVALNQGCATVTVQGEGFIEQGQAMSAPLSAWNPFVNPLLAASGSAVAGFGTQFGSAIAPFGPTVAGLGGTIDWFEGS